MSSTSPEKMELPIRNVLLYNSSVGPKHSWETNMKMDLKEGECEGMGSIL
jgi:hypothetical protein